MSERLPLGPHGRNIEEKALRRIAHFARGALTHDEVHGGAPLSSSEKSLSQKIRKEEHMGAAGMIYREIRFRFEDEITHCFVLIEATGDAPLGLQGWHTKSFGASYSALDLLRMWQEHAEKFGEPSLWPQGAPPQ